MDRLYESVNSNSNSFVFGFYRSYQQIVLLGVGLDGYKSRRRAPFGGVFAHAVTACDARVAGQQKWDLICF